MNIYIAKNGNDNNDGSAASPFATLERARDEARKYENAVVYINEGRYFITDTLELDGRDSNTEYRALGKVYFDGGVVIDNSDIKDHNEKIKCVDLGKYNIDIAEYGVRGFGRPYVNAPNELFIDTEPYKTAAFPKDKEIAYKAGDIVNAGNCSIYNEDKSTHPVIAVGKENARKWKSAKNAYLSGFPQHSWADDCIKISSFDEENGTVTLSDSHIFGFKATGHARWKIINLFEELSEAGEYYIDAETKTLYFIPESDISASCIQISVLDRVMIAVENAENISFSGITFENSRNSGIYIEGGSGISIRNCTFRNLGIMAIQMGQGGHVYPGYGPAYREASSWQEYIYEFAAWNNNAGTNHTVADCRIYNMGACGMILSGGDRKKLTTGNNSVYNCEIFNIGRMKKTYCAGIHIIGVGNSIRHCEMYNMPSMAINLHGNNHLLEYNRIHNVVNVTGDAGAIYMGRDASEVGNIFRYNFIYSLKNPQKTDFGICAIYLDDGTIYNEVYGNYFYDIISDGSAFFDIIHQNKGGLTSIGNNIFIDCTPGLDPNLKSNSYDFMHYDELGSTRAHTVDENDMRGVDVTSEAYKKEYPYLYRTYTENYNPGIKFWNNVVFSGQYNEFVDAENMDFTLRDDSIYLMSYNESYRITDDVFGLHDEARHVEKINFRNIGIVKSNDDPEQEDEEIKDDQKILQKVKVGA